MADGAAPSMSGGVFVQGVSHVLYDVVEATAVESERISYVPTDVVVAHSVGGKGDGYVPSSTVEEVVVPPSGRTLVAPSLGQTDCRCVVVHPVDPELLVFPSLLVVTCSLHDVAVRRSCLPGRRGSLCILHQLYAKVFVFNFAFPYVFHLYEVCVFLYRYPEVASHSELIMLHVCIIVICLIEFDFIMLRLQVHSVAPTSFPIVVWLCSWYIAYHFSLLAAACILHRWDVPTAFLSYISFVVPLLAYGFLLSEQPTLVNP
ncbi:hypothetical protein Tco_1251704 [Tanacetum coccineum]